MKKLVLFISVFISLKSVSQIGGTKAYQFLEIPATARAAALGGSNMSIWGEDINLIYSNPALLNPAMSKQVSLNYCKYVGDLNFGYAAYAHSLKKAGTVAAGIQFFSYGNFTGYDELGQKTTDFKASDYSINLNYAKPLADSMFNVGVALKTIISQYGSYSSYGNAVDFGVTYHNKKNLVISLLAKNIGGMYKNYTGGAADPLVRTVQLGLSYKPSKAPFKVFFVYDQLLKWNLSYISPVDTTGQSNTLGSTDTPKDSTGFQKFSKRFGSGLDNFMRHFTFGTEIVLSKNFNIRVAYNYRRQREMTLPDSRGFNGFSFGFGLRIKRFGFSYAFSKMAFPGSSNIVGLTLNL